MILIKFAVWLPGVLNVTNECQSVSTFHRPTVYIYILDAIPPIHVVSNHVATDKLTTANGGTFTSSSARLSS